PPRPGDDHYHRERRGPHAGAADRGSEGAYLFHARRNRHRDRTRKLGALRESHLSAATDALTRALLRVGPHTKDTTAHRGRNDKILETSCPLWTLCEVCLKKPSSLSKGKSFRSRT